MVCLATVALEKHFLTPSRVIDVIRFYDVIRFHDEIRFYDMIRFYDVIQFTFLHRYAIVVFMAITCTNKLALVEDVLQCKREARNREDPQMVAVVKNRSPC